MCWQHDNFYCANLLGMYYDVLTERARYFKGSKEGILNMCKVMEEIKNETRKEGIEEGSHGEDAGGRSIGTRKACRICWVIIGGSGQAVSRFSCFPFVRFRIKRA